MKPETKVGLLVFASLGALLAVILYLKGGVGQLFGREQTFQFGVVFSTLGDLKADAPVKFQEGPTVGRVREIVVDPKERTTKVMVGIDPDFAPLLTKNARIRITSQGLLGEKYINIIPGPRGGEGDQPVRPGMLLSGDEEGTLANLQSQGMTLLKTLQSTLSTSERAIHELVPRMIQVAERATKLADSVNANQKDLAKKLKSLSDEMVRLATRLNTSYETQMPGVEQAVADAKTTAQSLKRTAAEIEKLAGDPKVHADVREVIQGAKRAVDDVTRLTGKIDGLKTEIGYQGDYVAVGPARTVAGLVSGNDLSLRATGSGPEQGAFLSRVSMRVQPSARRYYQLGISNIGTRTQVSQSTYVGTQDPSTGRIEMAQSSGPLRPTFDLLYGHRLFGGLYARGGLLENTGGLGVEGRAWKDRLGAHADAYVLSGGAAGRVGLFYRPGPLRVGATLDRIGRADQNLRVGLGVEFDDPDIRYLVGLLGLSASIYR